MTSESLLPGSVRWNFHGGWNGIRRKAQRLAHGHEFAVDVHVKRLQIGGKGRFQRDFLRHRRWTWRDEKTTGTVAIGNRRGYRIRSNRRESVVREQWIIEILRKKGKSRNEVRGDLPVETSDEVCEACRRALSFVLDTSYSFSSAEQCNCVFLSVFIPTGPHVEKDFFLNRRRAFSEEKKRLDRYQPSCA